MKPKKSPHTPAFRHHKATGQGFVELHRRRIYLGRFDLPETRQKYHRLIAEWEANGRRLPAPASDIRIVELAAAFWAFAESYYLNPDGKPTSSLSEYKLVLRLLQRLYGSVRVSEFGTMQFKAVRKSMLDAGWCRGVVNQRSGLLKRIFKWGVSEALVPVEVHGALLTVEGLRRGRSEAREATPIKSVPDAIVDATLPHMTPTLRRMVEVQRLTGMRPGEVCIMRGCDLDTTSRVWVYKPATHKTQYRGRDRLVFIGPRAQSVLHQCLRADTQGYLFSPIQSEAERREAQHAARETPLSCGNKPGSNVKRRPRKQPRDHYDTQSYGRAIDYACGRAFPPPEGLDPEAVNAWRREHRWSPNQLRHSFGTSVRREHGLEASQVLLGHARADVTQIYAERDFARAVTVAAKIG